MKAFEVWRATGTNPAPVVVEENIAIHSYRRDELIYARLGTREYEHIEPQTRLMNGAIPYQRATRFYPALVMRMFDGMRDRIDAGEIGMLSRSVKIRGISYALHAKRFDTRRLGGICVFTCSRVDKKSLEKSTEWREKSFRTWFEGRLGPVPTQFRGNAMWAMDVEAMSDDEIVRHYERGVPKGARSAGDLLQQMMNSGALHVRDRRVGTKGHPYAMSFFRVPALGLIVSQREHLSST